MHRQPSFGRILAIVLLLAGLAANAPAQIIVKSDTATMNTAADWGGVAPGAAKIGLFDSTLSGGNAAGLILGGNTSLFGLIFTNTLNGAVTINPDGYVLTLGASGLDMSSANADVTLNCDLITPSTQTWAVGNNSQLLNLTLGGAVGGAAAPTILLATNANLIFNSMTNPVVGQVDGGGGTVKNNNTTGIPTLNQNVTGNHFISQINGVSGATMVLGGVSTSTNYVIKQFNTAGMLIKFNGGTWNLINDGSFNSNFELDNGVVINTNRNFYFNYGNSTFTIHGGAMVITNQYGLRLGTTFGANNTSVNFTGVQDGGTLNIGKSSFELGGTSGTADSYTLSGGVITLLSGINFNIGADVAGVGITAFTLSGTGKLFANSTVQGSQGPGAKQVFAFNGGTMVVSTLNATKLSGATAPAAQGTLYNAGGKVAPGDIGTPGKTTVTGNYTVSSPAASLAIDIGGTTQASAFQDTAAKYDFVSVSGTATLGGTVTANLINNYTPATNSAFTILTAGTSIIGTGANMGFGGYVPVTSNGIPAAGKYFQAVVMGKNLVLTNYGVALPALTASFAPTNALGTAPLPVAFNDSSTGAITNRHWNFGDASTLDTLSTNLTHTFTNLGTYTVVLTVSALDGSTASSTGKVSVVVPGPNLTWTGTQSGNWDLTTTNWVSASLAPQLYADADGVTFDDTSSRTNVVLNRIAAPSSINFNNTANPYTISGTGKITANTTLDINQGGAVTLLTANDYLGATTISAGSTLQLGSGTTSGSIDGTAAINNEGLLIVNTPDNHGVNGPVSGNGSLTKAGAGTFGMPNGVLNGAVAVNGGTFSTTDYTNIPNVMTFSVGNGGVYQFTAGPSAYYHSITMGAGGGGLSHSAPVLMGPLTGTGPFFKGGVGTMTFATDYTTNEYTGSTIVTGGTLQLGQSGLSGSVPGAMALNGGSLIVDRADAYLPTPISGNSSVSSITLKTTAAGNTNTLVLADGVNIFADLLNNSSGDLILNASANSTNNLAGGNGLQYANNTTLWLNSGNYVQNGAAFKGSAGNGGVFIQNGGSFTAASSTGNGGAYGFTGNMIISNGSFIVTSGRLNFNNDGQQFTVAGGLVFITNSTYGLRLGSVGGAGSANDAASKNFSGLQTGGAVVVNSGGGTTGVELGGIGTGKTATYLLTGGSLTIGSPSGLFLGATNDPSSTTIFTLTNNAKLSVAGNLAGGTSNSTNSVAVFAFRGGTLAAANYSATFLRDATASPQGTLVNSGGTLAPGDVGNAGRTIVTGNFAVASASSVLDIDIGGTVQAGAFQSTNAYDWVQVVRTNASVVLGGALNVRLINSYEPLAPLNNQFTILSINNGTNALGNPSLTGNFNNLSGGRVSLIGDPTRTFRVTVSSTNVVLDQYQTPSPQAYFTYDPSTGSAALTVTFTNLSNGTGLTNLWTFGDGGKSSAPGNVAHTYTTIGTNTVSLTVGSALGVSTYTLTNAVIVTAPTTSPAATGIGLLPDGNISLTTTGAVGTAWSLHATNNVGAPRPWPVIQTGTISVSPFTVNDLTATNNLYRFYQFSTP